MQGHSVSRGIGMKDAVTIVIVWLAIVGSAFLVEAIF